MSKKGSGFLENWPFQPILSTDCLELNSRPAKKVTFVLEI